MFLPNSDTNRSQFSNSPFRAIVVRTEGPAETVFVDPEQREELREEKRGWALRHYGCHVFSPASAPLLFFAAFRQAEIHSAVFVLCKAAGEEMGKRVAR